MNNVIDFGASVSATPAANTIAFQNAISAGPTYIPAGTYQCNQITISGEGPPVIIGDGPKSQILSTSTGSAAILFQVPAGPPSYTGMILKNFSVNPTTPNINYGLQFVLEEWGQVNMFEISNLFIGNYQPFQQQSIIFDNSINNQNGFFDGVVRLCYLNPGILGILVGDTLRISDNDIAGLGISISLTAEVGSRALLIEHNALTNRGGMIYLNGLEMSQIWWNNIEQPAYLGDYTGTLPGLITLNNCYNCHVFHNRIDAMHNAPGPNGPINGCNYDLVVQGSSSTYNLIDYNTFEPSLLSPAAVNLASATNVIGPNNYFEAGGFIPTPVATYSAIQSGLWSLSSTESSFEFGYAGTQGVFGDWIGDGIQRPGLYAAANGDWYLDHNPTSGDANPITFQFGFAGTIPIVGDWIGDGRVRPGLYDPTNGTWYLCPNINNGGTPMTFVFGGPGTLPIVGDWIGDGRIRPGYYNPTTGIWTLSHNINSGDNSPIIFEFMAGPFNPIAGNWMGDGRIRVGVYGAGNWYLNHNINTADSNPITFQFGSGAQGLSI